MEAPISPRRFIHKITRGNTWRIRALISKDRSSAPRYWFPTLISWFIRPIYLNVPRKVENLHC
jgi:hypothetical protein